MGIPKRAIKFAEDLATELRRYPDHFPELFYHIDPESFKRSALLYLDPKDLDKIKNSLLEQQDLLSGLAADPRLTTFYRLVNDQIARAMIGEVFTGFLADKEKAGTAGPVPAERLPPGALCQPGRPAAPGLPV